MNEDVRKILEKCRMVKITSDPKDHPRMIKMTSAFMAMMQAMDVNDHELIQLSTNLYMNVLAKIFRNNRELNLEHMYQVVAILSENTKELLGQIAKETGRV